MMRALRMIAIACLLAGLSACASTSGQGNALERAQYAWSAAIRWGDLDGAWMQLAPELRERQTLTEIERNRWTQVQITGYRVLSSEAMGEGGSQRLIEIGVVNRHTMAERQVRYREQWQWDAARKTWFVSSGLPDLWAGN
ncbi:MAG: hypothetical protein Q4G62_01300 [Pseudomonadota bacterium]|nr:hypothetical protein [Pseudomonadota bacterium]